MEDKSEKLLERELGASLEKNVSMSRYFRIGAGGIADFLYTASTANDLVMAASAARKSDLPYHVIGNGSAVLFSDVGCSNLIVLNQSRNILFSSDASLVMVDSGVELSHLINLAASRDLGGLEFLAGSSHTVGGALYHNIATNGFSIGQFVRSATVLVEQNGEIAIANVPGSWFDFGPTGSRLKNRRRQAYHPVILTVRFQLIKRRKDEILKLIQETLRSVGTMPANEKLIQQYFDDPVENGEQTAEKLLRSSGVSHLKVGGATVSRFSSNSIINQKNALASDVRALADLMREAVQQKHGISLKERVEYIGKW